MPLSSDLTRWLIRPWAMLIAASTTVVLLAVAVGAAVSGSSIIAVLAAAGAVAWLRYGFAVALRVRPDEMLVVHPMRVVRVSACTLRLVEIRHVPIGWVPVETVAVATRRRAASLVGTRGWTDDAVVRRALAALVAAAGPSVVPPGQAAAVRKALHEGRAGR